MKKKERNELESINGGNCFLTGVALAGVFASGFSTLGLGWLGGFNIADDVADCWNN